MKQSLLLIGLSILTINGYSNVYETKQGGVPDFSNMKMADAKKVNLSDDPITVVKANKPPKEIVWGSDDSSRRYASNRNFYQNTMQSSFPEQLTDNYFSFYGRNHHYDTLMSSTMGESMYSPNDTNNMRLQRNY